MREGIAVAGTMLVDSINEISAYPNAGELTQIRAVQRAVGGCVPNVAIDLKRIAPDLLISAIGLVGNDDKGDYLLERFAENGILTDAVRRVDAPTSFTEVMSVIGGQRTFFTFAGANAAFGLDDIDFDALSELKMLHLGYFLLLDKVDSGDGLRILREAKKRGIKTSIDLVSENSDRYALVKPCLAYTDNLIINESEAGAIVGIEPTDENLDTIAARLFEMGVGERVIIHTPAVGLCYTANGLTRLPSYRLPQGFIKGTTGAGDAFCAGCLVGIYRGLSDLQILTLGSQAATAALSAPDAISGLRDEAALAALCEKFER